MGRLDDIVARNKRAVDADNPLVTVLDGLGGNKPTAPVASFTLPSQRKSGTAAWKVLALMVLMGIALGIYECRMMDVTKRDDERRLREVR